MNTRKKIPKHTQYLILYKSAYTCAVCKNRNPIQIHHIDQNPKNNDEENLIVLCDNCHDEAHTRHNLSQNLTPDKLTNFKKKWELEIINKSIDAMMSSRPRSNLDWTYFNFAKIPRAIISYEIDYKNSKYEYLKSKNIINEEMEVLDNIDTTQHFFLKTLFDNTNINNAHVLLSYIKV